MWTKKHTNTVIDLGGDMRGWNDTTGSSRKWATPLSRSCWEAAATTIADRFPTSNPVWQEVVFLRTLRHFTPGRCYRSINNEAVNGAHKCPFRAKFWVYVAPTLTVITEPLRFGSCCSLLKDTLWRGRCAKHSPRGRAWGQTAWTFSTIRRLNDNNDSGR